VIDLDYIIYRGQFRFSTNTIFLLYFHNILIIINFNVLKYI